MMTESSAIEPVRVGIHTSVAEWAPEVKYVLRTLLRIAGFPVNFAWVDGQQPDSTLDLYYGPAGSYPAVVEIASSGLPYGHAQHTEPRDCREQDGLLFFDFDSSRASGGIECIGGKQLRFANDILFSSYWLLIGAGESTYRRDRVDNLHLDGSFFLRHGLQSRPLVSEYGMLLRSHFTAQGRRPLSWPWSGRGTPFAFTHDVDYPQILRAVESVRLLAGRGLKALPSVRGVLAGTNHFWKFAEWMEFEGALGTRPTFYFMARKGSLLEYALGTPDAFYDIRRPEFAALFRQLREHDCEIELHASFHAHRSTEQLRREKESLEQAAGVRVQGTRHHYWHLDPAAPHETLRRQEQAGLIYDSTLGFEYYPGFRRGCCHPFRVFHSGERRELNIVELPPTWMDDHFDRRLSINGIPDPAAHARNLVALLRRLEGPVVVDYHLRGMNEDFYPRYGTWLKQFIRAQLDSTVCYQTAGEIVGNYLRYEKTLQACSTDETLTPSAPLAVSAQGADFEVGGMRPEEISAVAQLHFDFFGVGEMHGASLASLGVEFLEKVFYPLNLDNPYLFVDVARYRGEVIGFSVYASDWRRVSREPLWHRPVSVAMRTAAFALRRPVRFASHMLGNLRFFTDAFPESVNRIRAWYLLLGVKAAYRTRSFRDATGISVTASLWDQMVRTLRAQGCTELWTAPGAHNGPINQLFLRHGAELLGQSRIQGVLCNLYRQPLVSSGSRPQ